VTKAKINIKIIMPLTAPGLMNRRKARKRGRVLGSNLNFLPVGPPLSW